MSSGLREIAASASARAGGVVARWRSRRSRRCRARERRWRARSRRRWSRRRSAAAATAPRRGARRSRSPRPRRRRQRRARARRIATVVAPRRAGARADRPAASDPAGEHERDHRVGGHEPGPVEGRVHGEHDHDGGHRQQADPLGRIGAGPPRASQAGRAGRRERPGGAEREADAEADDAEVGERLEDVAVGVDGERRARHEALVGHRIGAGAGPDDGARVEHVEREVPIEGVIVAGLRQAARVRRGLHGVRVGEVGPGVADRAAQAARAVCERADAGDGHERERDEHGDPELAAPRGRGERMALGGEAQHQRRHEGGEQHAAQQQPETVAGVLARRRARRGRWRAPAG